MADIQSQKLRGIVASLMERQAQETKPAASGVLGGLWEKATGEIERYNKAAEENMRLKTKQRRTFQEIEAAQERVNELNREISEGLHKEAEAAEAAINEIEKLTGQIEQLEGENRDLAESVTLSSQSLEEMNRGSGILRNGFTALIGKTAGATAAFFSFGAVLESFDTRMRFGAKTIANTAAATGDYTMSFGKAKEATFAWNDAINQTTLEMAQMGIGAQDSVAIMESMADGLRLTTDNEADLIGQTKQVTQDLGFMSKLLRVNTDELATATVDASKRFGKSTQAMGDELAGLFNSLQTIKLGSRDTVMSFGDLTRATLEAQSSFQGYNFNLKSTANVLGNVVAKAQEQGATYEMSMKAAQGLAGVITGGQAPDWAKYMAGKKLRGELVDIVKAAKRSGADVADALRDSFGKELSDTQVKGLENLAENWKRYGRLSSAKMAEELLRGTERSNEEMFEMMKKQADRPEGRELLMRVWGLDEAAATAATLAITTAKDVSEFTKIAEKAKAETAARKPPSLADLKTQTDTYVKAMGAMETGLGSYLSNILAALKQNPLVAGAVGAAGTGLGLGIETLQMGIGANVVSAITKSRLGEKLGGAVNRVFGRRGGVDDIVTSLRSGGQTFLDTSTRQSRVMGLVSKAATGVKSGFGAVGKGLVSMTSQVGRLGGPLARAAGKTGLVGLAGAAGYALGSLVRLVPGVDEFTEGMFNATARLLGFEHAVNDAEATQAALNNKSAVIAEALGNVTKGITTDYRRESFARMKAVVQLQNLSDEDLSAYAEKVAATKKLTKEEAMSRLQQLRAETVDSAKLAAARKEAGVVSAASPGRDPVGRDPVGRAAVARRAEKAAAIERRLGVVTELTDEQRQAVTERVAADLSPEMERMAVPMFQRLEESYVAHWTTSTELARSFWQQQMPAMAIDAWNRVGTAFEQRLGVPTSLPLSGGRLGGAVGGTRPGGGAGGRTGGAVVQPDGSISLNVMIPRDALDQSNGQAAGYAQ